MRYAIVLAFAGCWTGEAPQAPPPVAAPRPAPELAVTLERTPCLGMCPAYQVSISGAGIVQWHGESNVAVVGDRNGRATRAGVAQIAAKIDDIGFFDYDEYGEKQNPTLCRMQGSSTTCTLRSFTLCSDTSHVVITVRKNGVEHRVDDPRCGESRIDELGKLIDKVANTGHWIQGD